MKYIPFFLGLFSLCISIKWNTSEPGYEPIIGLLGAIMFFVGDYMVHRNKSVSLSREYENYTYESLKNIARELDTVPKRKSKDGYLEAIREKNADNNQVYLDRVRIALTAITLFFFISYNILFVDKKDRKINIDFVEYKIIDGKPVLRDSTDKFEVIGNDIMRNEIKLPIRLAFLNKEQEEIEIDKVELQYPSSISVESKAGVKINSITGIIVYEHNLSTLRVDDYYTAIEEIDTLVLKVKFLSQVKTSFDQYLMPYYDRRIVNNFTQKELYIGFGVKVFPKNRPVFDGVYAFTIRIPYLEQKDCDLNGIKTILDDKDENIFDYYKNNKLLDWTVKSIYNGIVVGYGETSTEDKEYHVIYSNGLLRKINVGDVKTNALLYSIIDRNGDQVPDYKLLPDNSITMISWDSSDFLRY